MGDIFLDCREAGVRGGAAAAEFLRFCPDLVVTRFDEPEFSLVHTSADEVGVWGPAWSADRSVLVVSTGRIALDAPEWAAARQLPGDGGLACRHVLSVYREGGVEAVGRLDGHFTMVIFDRGTKSLHVVTDRWGLAPCFEHEADGVPVFSSHPDALADATGEAAALDTTSLAEFVLTARVSAPFCHYARLRSLPVATVRTIEFHDGMAQRKPAWNYYQFRYDPRPPDELEAVAEELAEALKAAASRRTLPLFGKAAVALSGGLDSRTLLCATGRPGEVVAFCCHDVENDEFQIAREIAAAAGAEFVPLRRSPEYYAETAALGVRISGGLGSLASNHFLGFRDTLRSLGTGSLLTGCYWDYLFKGLGYNKRVNKWTTMESPGDFDFSFYARHGRFTTPLAGRVRERLEAQFPPDLREDRSEAALAEIEHRRIFPLFYEEDSTARSVPQRVMPWYIPFADTAVMSARLKMGTAMKLNRRAMIQATRRLCGPVIAGIPDANTGVAIGAPVWREAVSAHSRRLRSRLMKFRSRRATASSWLNWGYYIRHSVPLRALWEAPDPRADALFDEILGPGGWHRDPASYSGFGVNVFLRLLTLKTWLGQRPG